MVFTPGYDPEDAAGRYHRNIGGKNHSRPKPGCRHERRHGVGGSHGWKDPNGFAEDIWDFDDWWFSSGRCRSRLDVFGDLLWELVRLQSLLSYLLHPPSANGRFTGRSMSPSDDCRRSRRRDAHSAGAARKPRARSTHVPPRAGGDGADDAAFGPSASFADEKHRHRRRDASSSARLSSRDVHKDGDDVSRSSAPAASEPGKEEKGWRTLTKELRKLLSSKFSDKDDGQDDDSSATDTSPRATRKSDADGATKPTSYTTGISVTKFSPKSPEPRVVREIPIRRLNSSENGTPTASGSRQYAGHHSPSARLSAGGSSGSKSHSFNDRHGDWRSENRTNYPKYTRPPQPQRATMHFATPSDPTADPFLFASSSTAAPPPGSSSASRERSPRPSSFSHGSSSGGARVIFHPIFQTGRPHSTSFARDSTSYQSHARSRRVDDDDGLPPVIITEITDEEAEEIARKQQRERERAHEAHRTARSHAAKKSPQPTKSEEKKPTADPPSRLRCELCFGSLRIGSGDDMALSCDHLFHSKCILEWLGRKSTCPVCHVLIIKD